MKLVLPNGEATNLDETLSIDERKKVVDGILEKWETYFRDKWHMNKVKICLDVLSTYLVMAKEDEDKFKEDKFVLSKNKVKKMNRGDKKVTPFTYLSEEDQIALGFEVQAGNQE